MRKRISALGYYCIIFSLNLFLFSCNTNNTGSEKTDSTKPAENDTPITAKTIAPDSIPDLYGSDTLFSGKTFTTKDSAEFLFRAIHGVASAEACTMSCNATAFLANLTNADFIGFDYPPHPNIPIRLFGEVIRGSHPDNAPNSTFDLSCDNSNTPIVISSTSAHDIWIRRLVLSKQEINDYFQQVSLSADFGDLLKNPSHYRIKITPDLGTQQIHSSNTIQQYVGGSISVINTINNRESVGKRLHPCPVCEI